MTIVLLILGFIATAIVSIFHADLHASLPALARWIARRQAARLPKGLRDRMEEEWLAEIDATPLHLLKLAYALGLFRGVADLVLIGANDQARRERQFEVTVEQSGGLSVQVSGSPLTITVAPTTPDVGAALEEAIRVLDEHMKNDPRFAALSLEDVRSVGESIAFDFREAGILSLRGSGRDDLAWLHKKHSGWMLAKSGPRSKRFRKR